MITISLDEQGVFENNTDAAGNIVMVAGIVYDDKNHPEDTEAEKSRVRKYFEQVCKGKGAAYPQALHIGHGQDRAVRFVKQEYAKTLGAFLKEGTYQGRRILSGDGKRRLGEYYVYAIVKSRQGKQALVQSGISNLINENQASNLYMHMVEDVISRLLFYNNEFIAKEEVSLDLATRVYMGQPGEDLSEHTDIGYRTRDLRNKEMVFLTNADVFRTALERDMLLEEENDIMVKSLTARSIDYDDAGAGHEFLYLADAVCTCLGFGNEYGIRKNYLDKTWERMEELAGDKRLLFCYDAVDTEYTKAWRLALEGNIYKALSVAFDAFNRAGEAAAFYKQVWEQPLCEKLKKSADASAIATAVRKFAQSARNNNITQQKLVYIFEKLKSLAETIAFSNVQDKAVLYELYDAGVAAYNHVGNPQKARECAEKCREHAGLVGIEKEIRNRNKQVVGLCDSFRYPEALKIAETSYKYYEISYEAQKNLFGEDVIYNSLEYGIACSQLAQVYSFMQDARAELLFQKALSLMEKATADYYITESYLLHYYLQTGEREKYETYAKEYFGGHEDLEEQLEYIISAGSAEKNPILSLKFAMYVYLKGIAIFYCDEISEELALKLADINGTIQAVDAAGLAQLNGHPWEISYKYLAMIMYKKNNARAAESYVTKMNACLKVKGSTLEIIQLLGDAEVARLREPDVDNSLKIQRICELIAVENPAYAGMEQSLEEIQRVVTYTYR